MPPQRRMKGHDKSWWHRSWRACHVWLIFCKYLIPGTAGSHLSRSLEPTQASTYSMVAIDATANATGCHHNLTSIHNHKKCYQLFHTQNANAWEELRWELWRAKLGKLLLGNTWFLIGRGAHIHADCGCY
jgi:hypothetical protein